MKYSQTSARAALLIILLFLAQSEIAQAETANPLAQQLEKYELLNKKCKASTDALRYEDALAQCKEWLDYTASTFGEKNIRAAYPLRMTGLAHGQLENYSLARDFEEKAIAIFKESPDDVSADLARTLYRFGISNFKSGKIHSAEEAWLQAKLILENKDLTNTETYNNTLTTLALIYMNYGQYEKAEDTLRKAINIIEKIYGIDDLRLAPALSNLRKMYIELKQYDRALPVALRAIEIREKHLGPKRALTIILYDPLAIIYKKLGNPHEARKIYDRILPLLERIYGKEHHNLIQTLDNYGILLCEQEDYNNASEIFNRVDLIWKKYLDRNSNHQNDSRGDLELIKALCAGPYVKTKELVALLKNVLLSYEKMTQDATGTNRLESLLESIQEVEQHLLALSLLPDPAARRLAVQTGLLLKGRGNDLGFLSEKSINRSDPEIVSAFEQWTRLRKDLLRSQMHEEAPRGSSPEADKALAQQQQIKLQLVELEAYLSRRSSQFLNRKIPAPEEIIARVSEKLGPKRALLDVHWVRSYAFKQPGSVDKRWGPAHYVAQLILPNQQTHTVDLGEADRIEQLVADFLVGLRDKKADPVPAAKKLYRQIFAPLQPKLRGISHVLVAPDGALNLIPFDALHDGREYLIERYTFSYLLSGRDLLRESPKGDVSPPLVLADPDFSLSGSDVQAARTTTRELNTESLYNLTRSMPPLPGTAQEADLWRRLRPDTRILIGAQATEQALKQAQAPSILVIATHGIFLEDVRKDQAAWEPGGGAERRAKEDTPRSALQLASVPAASSVAQLERKRVLAGARLNPMTASALLFAGAAHASRSHDPDHDNILTAEEAQTLNLNGTELVVLSACDTGRGEVRIGQGVLGLRRAFLLSGAEALVTSLWRVDDAGTSELMQLYYQRVLGGEPRLGALRSAMRELKQNRAHPYYWAPFIGIGKDGPLGTGIGRRKTASALSG
jgi:CHAT domain-containing protein/Tfp pilus assembly protein PilF